eukprot:5046553-Ditylum_brightwellii.AAC.1
MERVLDAVSINSNNLNENNSTLEYPEVFPYRVCDIPLPSDNTGYVYFLISCRDTGRTYIGQTINISRRLTEHNSGYGADGTTNPIYRPYAVAGYKEKRWKADGKGIVNIYKEMEISMYMIGSNKEKD